ncbi:MAG: M24 family metallopeptidase [Phycisphaera sp.]|nr:M24 family metallopeptidase [Phycisphaera sp.]
MPELYFKTDTPGRDLFFTPDFTAEELAQRRQRAAQAIGHDAVLLIPGAPPVATDFPTQDAVFYYLSGMETVHAYLIIEGGSGRTRVFLPSRNTLEGELHNKLGFEDADLIRDRMKFDEVLPSTELTAALTGLKKVFLPFAEVEGGGAGHFTGKGCAKRRAEEPWDSYIPRHERITCKLKELNPGVEVLDACAVVNPMRMIKSKAEVEVMRQAGKLTAAAVVECMKICKPGMNENSLQAMVEYVFRDLGRCGLGYGVIAAGGKRTWDGHYHLNNITLQNDEIILLDCGPDLRHYTSDIARLWPVNGVFSPWHRRVYGFIVEYHKALIAQVRPGVMVKEVYANADKHMASLCTEPNAPYHDMKPIFENMVKRGVGYLNHAVGLSVHDPVGGTWRTEPLKEGFVVVVDPMVWCEPEHQYIRVEDTIVVTADGCERLTGDAPYEIDELERLLR